MSATIIDGKATAAEVRGQVAAAVSTLVSAGDTAPGLAVVMIGENPASQVYVRNKAKMTEATGMRSIEHRLPDSTTEEELLTLVAAMNADPAINGILVQLPLPLHIDADRVLAAIDPDKDVDGFHPMNAGALATGTGGLVPCTPLGCWYLITKHHGPDLSGLNAVVIGRSNIVGKPMAQLLLAANATVTIAHSRTKDLPAVCAAADILVAAVGRPEMVPGAWVKPGATVIDVGINRLDPAPGAEKGRLVGDVDYASAAEKAGAMTPVPGGVGPMTIACLLVNTVLATCQQRQLPVPDALASWQTR
ncbi:MAG: bifunctional methylenetetrahydrofolate dehydrogenase/methenyltetrahydrofolate cyclohydrolase FolD [Pseudomonadota bacterium]